MPKTEYAITQPEYRRALELSNNEATPVEEASAYWQLCRAYRDQIFYRDEVERALQLLRK